MDWLKEFEQKPPLSEVSPNGLNRLNQIQTRQLSQSRSSQIAEVLWTQKATKKPTKAANQQKNQKSKVKNETNEENSQQIEKIINDDKAEDQMMVLETYADYKPAKLTIGVQHPDLVVETASMSSVAPTDITYELKIPQKTIKSGVLSALQLESIIYASQAHAFFLEDGSRAGFLIGMHFGKKKISL